MVVAGERVSLAKCLKKPKLVLSRFAILPAPRAGLVESRLESQFAKTPFEAFDGAIQPGIDRQPSLAWARAPTPTVADCWERDR